MDWKKYFNKIKRWNKIFCGKITCRINLLRDVVIVSISVTFALVMTIPNFVRLATVPAPTIKKPRSIVSTEQITLEIRSVQEKIDMSDWEKYQNDWYGFELKYPLEWIKPTSLAGKADDRWEYRYQFRKNDAGKEDIYSGFDVVIYSVARIEELYKTEEYPSLISDDLKSNPECEDINEHLIETGNYPAEEIYIPADDSCYRPALFFSMTRDAYIYNFVPITNDGVILESDPGKIIDDEFPEFYAMIATAELTDIVRPKPAPIKPKINAPYPVSYKVVNGRLVCAKDNDKPSKSNKGKGKHLDMECCLDPDEYPNPHCYYDPKKYGKYL